MGKNIRDFLENLTDYFLNIIVKYLGLWSPGLRKIF